MEMKKIHIEARSIGMDAKNQDRVALIRMLNGQRMIPNVFARLMSTSVRKCVFSEVFVFPSTGDEDDPVKSRPTQDI
jgi:hypothetical protein